MSGDPDHSDHEWTNILLREIADEIERGFKMLARLLASQLPQPSPQTYYPLAPTFVPAPIAKPTYTC